MQGPNPVRSHVGAFSSAKTIAKVDGRTAQAKYLRAVTAALIEHKGGRDRCSTPELMLIEHTAVLALRLKCIVDRYMGGENVDHLDDRYRQMGEAQAKMLDRFGLDRSAAPTISLADYLELKAGKAA